MIPSACYTPPPLPEKTTREFNIKCIANHSTKSREKLCTNLRTVRVPNTLSTILRLGLGFPFLQVLFRRLSLEILELRPPVFENLDGDVKSVDLRRTDISRILRRGRDGVGGRERDFLAYR